MSNSPNPPLNSMIIEIVENQLRDRNPPETLQTFECLLKNGYSDEEAKELIGCVVSAEITDVLNSNKPFNLKRFSKHLQQLPKLPWE